MTKPTVIVDAHWRTMGELFSDADQHRLHHSYNVIWARDAPIPAQVLQAALPDAEIFVSAMPDVGVSTVQQAPNLRAIIEVSGAFPDTIDYPACAERGIEVLSCAPGFRESAAEMALAMALSAGRGLVAEHEAFRTGKEAWLSDRLGQDFTLFGANVGFVGFGSIGQEIAKLLGPFRTELSAYDPWLPESVAAGLSTELVPLCDVMSRNRLVFVAAAPSSENKGLINAAALAHMQDGAVLVVVSRAHLVDFPALLNEVARGRIKAAIDVFPSEPVPLDDPIRQMPGLILSPHRAAAVPGGRQLIGRMIMSDIEAILKGDSHRQLAAANPETVTKLSGVGDANKVGALAVERE